jgi:hypothetical protein
MTIKQIEERMIELKHREPFVPFVVEMADGESVQVPHSGLAINETGAGFIDSRRGIVDIDFKKVLAIHLFSNGRKITSRFRSRLVGWVEQRETHRPNTMVGLTLFDPPYGYGVSAATYREVISRRMLNSETAA